ncbi:Sugar transport protein 6 [Hibiscus syriacus]|uniref:Sugar transport protein 6 n=1 Tax=Hibiscus syriacus TaxID=106335 RepID=A0A6A2WXN7_HIBSY|nr:Sugar transport protein 6 [Hibiscus syriacus]
MQAASVFFFIGAILNLTAKKLGILILGRLFLGAGVGCGNQLLITVGILIANLVNYFTSNIRPYGWRISLGGGAVPAIILLVGSFIIVETPASLIERGKKERGLKTLKRIRGVDDVEKEFEEIVRATEISNKIKNPFRELTKRRSVPPVICGTIIHVFQQFTGINVVMFYAPVLFQPMGFGSNASLLSAVMTGTVNVLPTLIAVFSVDKAGRKKLLILGASICLIAQYLTETSKVPSETAKLVVGLICLYVNGFAWSWGPLGWLISSEVFPLETRSGGFFLAVATNMFCTFLIAQAFLSMLCTMQAYIFFFFAAWLVTMIVFVAAMLPETKGIPIDEMVERLLVKNHTQSLPETIVIPLNRSELISTIADRTPTLVNGDPDFWKTFAYRAMTYGGKMDALIVAWLPGTEGKGITDLVFGDYDFEGRLPTTWFRTTKQFPINNGDNSCDPLFPLGFGLTCSKEKPTD